MDRIVSGVIGGLVVALVAPLVIWATRSVWRWLHTPYKRDDVAHLPFWLQQLRWLAISEPDRRLSPSQWVSRYFLCPLEGHEFPRNLPNNAGRWCFKGQRGDGDHWFGVCQKCEAMLQAHTEERLDELEKSGMRPHRSRRPKRQTQPA